MTRGIPIDPDVVKSVFKRRLQGHSQNHIAREFSKSRKCIKHILRSHNPQNGELLDRKKRGRKRKTTIEEDDIIVRFGKELADSPITKVTARINEGDEVQAKISRGTVQRRLKQAGAKTVTAVSDDLTEVQKKNRVKFALG